MLTDDEKEAGVSALASRLNPSAPRVPVDARLDPARVPRAVYLSSDPLIVAILPPPHLRPLDNPGRRVHLLARAYEGATEAATGKRCWMFARERKHISESKHFKLLLAGAAALDEQGVSPASWCAFSMDVWAEHHDSKSAPPLAWMFSPKRIEERFGWWKAESESYGGGRIILSPLARDFMRRQSNALTAVASLPECATDAQVDAVMERYLPGGQALWVSRVRAETLALREEMRARVDAGGWVWGARVRIDEDGCWRWA
jgi:hypothetical protein